MKKAIAGLFVVGIMATASGTALAADNAIYGAIDIGQSKYGTFCDPQAGVVITSCDDKDTSYRLAGGYNFNKNLGVEVSYSDYGKASGTGTALGVTGFVSGGATAFQLVGNGILPLGNQFSLTVKAGLASVDVKSSVNIAGSASASNTNFVWGVGAQYDFNQSFGIRVNYEDLGTIGDNATTGTDKLSNISAGVVFRF